MQNLVIDEFTQKIINFNKRYQPIGQIRYGGGVIFLVEETKADDFDIQIVKVQWTKTQYGFAIQVPNYYAGRRHNLRVPMDTLKQAKEFVSEVMERGHARHWMGHIVATTTKFFNDRRA